MELLLLSQMESLFLFLRQNNVISYELFCGSYIVGYLLAPVFYDFEGIPEYLLYLITSAQFVNEVDISFALIDIFVYDKGSSHPAKYP